jgi:ACT domain-containing protein
MTHNQKPILDKGESKMQAVVSVIGKDMTGIIAKVSNILYKNGVNIEDITQSVLKDLFAMVMLVDISSSKVPFSQLVDELDNVGKEMGIVVRTMHEDIFNSMHKI